MIQVEKKSMNNSVCSVIQLNNKTSEMIQIIKLSNGIRRDQKSNFTHRPLVDPIGRFDSHHANQIIFSGVYLNHPGERPISRNGSILSQNNYVSNCHISGRMMPLIVPVKSNKVFTRPPLPKVAY